jgi:pyruvate/2-oxoglutarate/acetoin dehydrogenase E1 component/TPP-dependent pyruvate/acetoin dehydrogenase alpha subunit
MPPTTSLSASELTGIYQTMVRIAACNEKIEQLLATGATQFMYYPCRGQEAIPAAISVALQPDDYVLTTYRGIHDVVAKGTPMGEIMAEILGKMTGTSKGKGGPMHLSDPNCGLMVTTGIVGATLPISTGLGLASKLKSSGQVVVCNFGDGAANIGAFGESLNMASLWNLPIVFVCQNNRYAEFTSFEESTRMASVAQRAAGYSMPGESVDGTDPNTVHAAASVAIERARNGGGPTLLECVAHRLQGHYFGSDETHMNQENLAAARAPTPIQKLRQSLIDSGVAETEVSNIDEAARSEAEQAVADAMEAPEPAASELFTDVFEDPVAIPYSGSTSAKDPDLSGLPTENISFGAAINQALDQAMAADERVILMGEDIADPAGGVGKITAGLSTKHGTDRVLATPISEQAIVGSAIGAAMAGFKTVPEIMINDFLMVCMDQVANHAAKLRYMSGGRTSVPLTIRSTNAGNVGRFGSQHSQSLETWLAHVPGMKVILPSDAIDAKGLLLSCIDDPDPCFYLDAMRLYYNVQDVPTPEYRIPLGVAKKRREGSDISIISYSWPVVECMAAAEQLAEQGIDAEVIDLRTLVPLDWQAVKASVAKTKRAIIVHAATEFCGFGAELAAKLHEELHGSLAAPVKRLGAAYSPPPFALSLETHHFPTVEGILELAEATVQYSG